MAQRADEVGRAGGDAIPSKDDAGAKVHDAIGERVAIDAWICCHVSRILLAYLAAVGLFGVATIWFYPSFGYPGGDEGTYFNSALDPWTLKAEFFEGFPPRELTSPFALRLFLWPFSLVFGVFGFTVVGGRLVVLAYGLALLYVTYLVGRRLSTPIAALAAVVLVSLSPQFLYFTHGVRAESLLTLCLMVCVWLGVRDPDAPTARSCFWMGLVAGGSLLVHYNAIVFGPLFAWAMFVVYRGEISRRAWSAYAGGLALAAVAFLLTNVLPGLESVRAYGLRPVSFFASSEIPLLQGADAIPRIQQGVRQYARYLANGIPFERATMPWTALLMLAAVVSLLYRPTRRVALVGNVICWMVVALLVFVPNHNDYYLYYFVPPTMLLLTSAAARLPRHVVVRAAAAVPLLLTVVLYAREEARVLLQRYRYHQDNVAMGRELRALIEDLGDPAALTVMGGQEFYPFAADCSYRTFHSFIATKDFGQTLDLVGPDVVILHPRTIVMLLRSFSHRMPMRRDQPHEVPDVSRQTDDWIEAGYLVPAPSGNGWILDGAAIEASILDNLLDAGYEQFPLQASTWDRQPVSVFVRR